MRSRHTKSKKYEQGFTLIEMAIVMMILGLIAAPLLLLYNNYQKRERELSGYENVYQAVDGLQNFRRLNGFYPCPAPMNVNRTDPNYGRAVACQQGAATDTALGAAGNCTQGVCKEQAVAARIGTLGAGDPDVIVGAIPFRDLQVDESETYDGYGGRLYYAITQSMTAALTLNDDNGAISVRNVDDQEITSPIASGGTAAYVVFHTGATQNGAYSRDGVLIEPCAGAEEDVANCTDGFEDGTTPADSIYIASRLNDVPGANFYDDEILYFSQISDPMWRRVDANPENIEELVVEGVAVGPVTPAANVLLDVRAPAAGSQANVYVNGPGGVANTGGDIRANRICDGAGNCFAPELIAGSVGAGTGGMRCAAGEYMTGIEGGGPMCENDIQVRCSGATPIMRGFDGAGNPICVAPPGLTCPAATRTVCTGGDVTLAAAADTTLTGFFNRGACRQARYRCQSGAWVDVAGYPTGHCTNTIPAATVTTHSCGPGYGGATYTVTTPSAPVCGGGAGPATSTRTTDCICVGGSGVENSNCQARLGANWQNTPLSRTINYPAPSCAATPEPWDTSSCQCISGNQTAACSTPGIMTMASPNGWTGSATRTVERLLANLCVPTDPNPAWNTTGCSCDTSDRIRYQSHACADPVCEIAETDPTKMDKYVATVNPATCVVGPEVLESLGSCRARGFTWISVGDTGADAPSRPPSARIATESCSCSDHNATLGVGTRSCFIAGDPTNSIHNCKCQ